MPQNFVPSKYPAVCGIEREAKCSLYYLNIYNIIYQLTELRQLSLAQLNEIFMELEVLIREFSETLIAELALRDELEYEKELKNTFISLLLAVQNKRRQYHIEKKKRPGAPRSPNLNTSHSESKVCFNYIMSFYVKIFKIHRNFNVVEFEFVSRKLLLCYKTFFYD